MISRGQFRTDHVVAELCVRSNLHTKCSINPLQAHVCVRCTTNRLNNTSRPAPPSCLPCVSAVPPHQTLRALAFAYDVELRLEPWYGRNILPKTLPFTPAMSDSNLVAPGIAATIGPPGGGGGGGGGASCDTLRGDSGGGSKGSSGGSSSDGGGGGGDGGSHRLRAADDLLACGCILAEMCAGEPVLSAPSFVRGERVLGGGERRGGAGGGGEGGSWLDVAVDVPPALRGAIAALTHADPEKVCTWVGWL